jgi:phospho-N-acetylmuramoyl-pentapeptide-transferase
MGGLLIIAALTTSTLLWARLDNVFVWVVLGVTLSFAGLGFADDYAKVRRQTVDGVSGRLRLAIGFAVAAVAAVVASSVHPDALTNSLAVPVFSDVLLNLRLLFVPFAMIVIVGPRTR